jgi:hypothetical protein
MQKSARDDAVGERVEERDVGRKDGKAEAEVE